MCGLCAGCVPPQASYGAPVSRPPSTNRRPPPRGNRRSGNRTGGNRKSGVAKPRTPRALTPRAVAARALASVLGSGQALESALAGVPEFAALEARDRAFVWRLLRAALRQLGQVDAALAPFVRRAPPAEAQAVLRLGTVELLVLRTPVHAAVGESVAAAESLGLGGFKGLVNAVLRKVADAGPGVMLQTPPKANIPGWLRASWEEAYGGPAMRRIAAQMLKTPPLDLSVKGDPEAWAKTLGGEVVLGHTVRLSPERVAEAGDITQLPGFADGAWWVQDAAAAIPARMLEVQPGERVLDLCAAPGGKTLQLAAAGARVTALDINGARLQRLHANLARTGLAAEVVEADLFAWEPDAPFDAVLLDAPCTATGTLRRHPEVVHTKTPKTLSNLSKLQRRALARASRWVAPGGRLVYAVCSLQPEEGEQQVERFLAGRGSAAQDGAAQDGAPRPEFRLNPVLTAKGVAVPSECISGGQLRSLPHHMGGQGGMDGFFAARLDRA